MKANRLSMQKTKSGAYFLITIALILLSFIFYTYSNTLPYHTDSYIYLTRLTFKECPYPTMGYFYKLETHQFYKKPLSLKSQEYLKYPKKVTIYTRTIKSGIIESLSAVLIALAIWTLIKSIMADLALTKTLRELDIENEVE